MVKVFICGKGTNLYSKNNIVKIAKQDKEDIDVLCDALKEFERLYPGSLKKHGIELEARPIKPVTKGTGSLVIGGT